MDASTEQQRDWMRHLIGLGQSRAQHPKFLTPQDVARLKWEIRAEQAVLNALTAGRAVDDRLGPVLVYMGVYADAQIARYGGRLDDQAFRERVLTAKDVMWDGLRKMKEGQK